MHFASDHRALGEEHRRASAFRRGDAAGLDEGEKVDVELLGSDIIIRRPLARAQQRQLAEQAAAEIRAESGHYTLGELAIRDLRREGRRG